MTDKLRTDVIFQAKVQTLQQRYQKLRDQLERLAVEAGRRPADLQVVAVTKEVDERTAMAAVQAGFLDLGENRPQALVQKADYADGHGFDCRFHQIGRLQRNKVRSILRRATLIHSVDGLRLFRAIERIAGEEEWPVEILLQVNVSGEASKQGFEPDELRRVFPELLTAAPVSLRGLMTMAPLGASERKAKELFVATAQLQRDLAQAFSLPAFDLLSMGMSDDYPAAIAAGATHLRLGRLLFSGLDRPEEAEHGS